MGGNESGGNVTTIQSFTYSGETVATPAATIGTAKEGGIGTNFFLGGRSYMLGGSAANTAVDDLVHSSEASSTLSTTLSASQTNTHGMQAM
jgi:hypothetical protein